mgnify:CR=1 FL=1
MARSIDQQIAATQAKLARLKERQKASETRRKIIVGSVAISNALKDPEKPVLSPPSCVGPSPAKSIKKSWSGCWKSWMASLRRRRVHERQRSFPAARR